jgi:hypothetical protein
MSGTTNQILVYVGVEFDGTKYDEPPDFKPDAHPLIAAGVTIPQSEYVGDGFDFSHPNEVWSFYGKLEVVSVSLDPPKEDTIIHPPDYQSANGGAGSQLSPIQVYVTSDQLAALQQQYPAAAPPSQPLPQPTAPSPPVPDPPGLPSPTPDPPQPTPNPQPPTIITPEPFTPEPEPPPPSDPDDPYLNVDDGPYAPPAPPNASPDDTANSQIAQYSDWWVTWWSKTWITNTVPNNPPHGTYALTFFFAVLGGFAGALGDGFSTLQNALTSLATDLVAPFDPTTVYSDTTHVYQSVASVFGATDATIVTATAIQTLAGKSPVLTPLVPLLQTLHDHGATSAEPVIVQAVGMVVQNETMQAPLKVVRSVPLGSVATAMYQPAPLSPTAVFLNADGSFLSLDNTAPVDPTKLTPEIATGYGLDGTYTINQSTLGVDVANAFISEFNSPNNAIGLPESLKFSADYDMASSATSKLAAQDINVTIGKLLGGSSLTDSSNITTLLDSFLNTALSNTASYLLYEVQGYVYTNTMGQGSVGQYLYDRAHGMSPVQAMLGTTGMPA